MDFMWFWVIMGIGVEILRRSYRFCYPKQSNKSNKNEGLLSEPLLQADGTCLFACCAKDLHVYESESGASTSESDEIESADEIEEIEICTDSLIDKRKGKQVVTDDGRQGIVGRVYRSDSGHSKPVQFKVRDDHFSASDNAVAQALKREASAKVHPQPLNGSADEVHISISESDQDIKQLVTSAALTEEHTLSPPVPAVMEHGNVREGDEIQSAKGQCSYQVD